MTQQQSRIAPGVRIVMLPNETAAEGIPIDLDGRVLSFSFEDSERMKDKLSLQLDNHDLSLFEREDLMGGAVLEVSWGYPGNMSPPRRAVVRKIKGFLTLTLGGQAQSVLMDKETKTRCFMDTSCERVVAQVAGEYGYWGQFLHVQESETQLDTFQQVAETDTRFLRRLAAKREYEFYVDHTGLHFHERRQDTAPTHVFIYHSDPGRGDVLSLSIESDLVRRVGKVTVKGRDPLNKTTIESTATSENVERSTLGDIVEVVDPDTGNTTLERRNATKTVHPTSAATPAKVDTESKARFRRAERSTLKLNMQVVGDPTIAAKSVVELRCDSAYLSGKYYVKEAKHSISSSGYTCDLKLERDGPGRVKQKNASAKKSQGGQKNTQEPADKKQLKQVEIVDPETGRTRIEYRKTS